MNHEGLMLNDEGEEEIDKDVKADDELMMNR